MAADVARVSAFDHLTELRRRLSVCALVMLVGSSAGFAFRGPLIAFLSRPLGQRLFYTSPQGGFDFVMRVSLLIGLIVTLPTLVYNLLRYIEPALPRPLGRRTIARFVGASAFLTACGVSFAYFVGMPAALAFFNTVGSGQLHALITADQYLNFVLTYLATFAIVFHLPLLFLIINHVTPLGPGTLGRWRKWVITGSFAVALVVPSAPDPLSQVILAIPLILLYESSIWLVWLANRHHPRSASDSARSAQSTRHASSAPVIDLSQSAPSEPAPPPRPKSHHVLDLRSTP